MAQTVESVLQMAEFYSDNQIYTFVQLPPGAMTAAAGIIAEIGEPFVAVMVDKDEVSLMIPAEAWSDFQHRLPGANINPTPYRLLTIDLPLEPTLIGLMARVSQTLSDAQISILPFAAFSRDHLFVADHDFDRAHTALTALKSAR